MKGVCSACHRVSNTSKVGLKAFSLSVFLLPNHIQTTSAEDSISFCGLGFRALPSFCFKVLPFHSDSQHTPLAIPCSNSLGGFVEKK